MSQCSVLNLRVGFLFFSRCHGFSVLPFEFTPCTLGESSTVQYSKGSKHVGHCTFALKFTVGVCSSS